MTSAATAASGTRAASVATPRRAERAATWSMNDDKADQRRAGISTRAMEIAVALRYCSLVGALVVFDSYRLGSRWGDDGPQSGYFPFYIGLLICISSVVNARAARLIARASRRTACSSRGARSSWS